MKKDGTKQLHAYVQAVRKQGGKLLPTVPSHSKVGRPQAAIIRAELKKNSN